MHPARFGKYPVERLLKRGGTASVYLAHQPGLNRHVAIKVLHISDEEELRQRFLREMVTIAQLRHPHIVAVYDADTDNGEPFLVMEYVSGESLRDAIKRRPDWSVLRRLQVIDELAQGLEYAHQAGVIHRDVKPANVMLDSKGVVKVVDFGIAHTSDSDLTQIGSALGTPSYWAPEQVTGAPVDARSDIFAVGAVAYELLSYVRAFERSREIQPPPPLATVCPDVPAGVARVVMKALEMPPARRHRDMSHFRADLRAALVSAGYAPSAQDAISPAHDVAEALPTVVSRSIARRHGSGHHHLAVAALAMSVVGLALSWARPWRSPVARPPEAVVESKPMDEPAAPPEPVPDIGVAPAPPLLPTEAGEPARGRAQPMSTSSSEPQRRAENLLPPDSESESSAPVVMPKPPSPASPPEGSALHVETTGAAVGVTVGPLVVIAPSPAAPVARTEAPPVDAPPASPRDEGREVAAVVERWALAMSRRDFTTLEGLLRDSTVDVAAVRRQLAPITSWRVAVTRLATTFEEDGQRARVRGALVYEEMVIAGSSVGRAAGTVDVMLEQRAGEWRITTLQAEMVGR